MRKLLLVSAPLLALAAASPAFSQGATQTPPSPNSAASGPTPSGSVPAGAETVSPGVRGTGRVGTATTTRGGRARHQRRRARH